MPIIKSAKKRVKVAHKATVRNSKTKRALKDAVKSLQKAIEAGDKKTVATAHAAAQSTIGKAAKKHVMHKNKAARKQSQLAKAAKAAGLSVVGTGKKATPAAKPAAKKAPAKKTVAAKKPAAKKTPAKK